MKKPTTTFGGKLTKQFGYCIIPKDTALFSGKTKDSKDSDCKFFGLSFFSASGFGDIVEVYRVKKSISVIFLCDFLHWQGRVESAIPSLYNLLFPEDLNLGLDDLDIKQRDLTRRSKFTSLLEIKHGINGWLSTVEGHSHLEVCLFPVPCCQSHLQLENSFEKNDRPYYKNALRKKTFIHRRLFLPKPMTVLKLKMENCPTKNPSTMNTKNTLTDNFLKVPKLYKSVGIGEKLSMIYELN
jgi:hypothetical protein